MNFLMFLMMSSQIFIVLGIWVRICLKMDFLEIVHQSERLV